MAFSARVLQAALPALFASTMLAQSPPFGHEMLREFGFEPGYVNLNHGSYGSAPRVVTAAAAEATAACEANPDAFYRFNGLFPQYEALRQRLAAYIGSGINDTVMVENASQGVNAVLRSLARSAPAAPRGKILLLSTAYYMVKQTAAYLAPGDQTVIVNISLPLTDAAVLSAVSAALEAHPGEIYVASFSHIISVPGAILPVKSLTELCHSHGVLVLIDGAHALGQVPVDVRDIGADFWLGNMHKWGYGAKGSALLWVAPAAQPLIEPTTISFEGRGATHFLLAFSYVGTTSYSNYLAMGAALDFRARVGGEVAIMSYVHTLAVDGGALLALAWGTDVLHSEALYGAMVDVRVPTTNATLATSLGAALMERFHTFVPVYDIGAVGGAPGVYYARCSAQIFNELDDFQYLADSVLTLIREANGA